MPNDCPGVFDGHQPAGIGAPLTKNQGAIYMSNNSSQPRTLAEKVWDDHVVVRGEADANGSRNPDLI
ncbi:3-isopropylmalate dehydratase large subunit, partial [Gordonia effusa NBRC 100432]